MPSIRQRAEKAHDHLTNSIRAVDVLAEAHGHAELGDLMRELTAVQIEINGLLRQLPKPAPEPTSQFSLPADLQDLKVDRKVLMHGGPAHGRPATIRGLFPDGTVRVHVEGDPQNTTRDVTRGDVEPKV